MARVASAIHENSQVLVTLGSAAVKWNCTKFEGNYWSDASLIAQYNMANARLDFYSPHFYGWVVKYFGNFAVDKTPVYYGLNDRPCVIGENPAKGVFDDGATPTLVIQPSQMLLAAYKNGWKGLMPWTSNGADVNGNLNDFGSGLLALQKAYPELVNPTSTTGMAPELKRNKSGSFLERVYPNPSGSGIFTIVLSDYHGVVLHVSDEKGTLIFNKRAGSAETIFSAIGLSKGVYILSAIKDGLVENRKLVLN